MRHSHRYANSCTCVILLLCLAVVCLPKFWPSLAHSNVEPFFLTGNRLLQDLDHAIARVQPLLDRYGYPAVFLAVLVEGLGMVASGQTLLMAAAFDAARGNLNITWVLLWAFTAAVVGNSLGYLIGRRGGRPLLHKFKVSEPRLQRLEGYFARRGKWVVILARFFDGLRQLSGIVAGMLKMPWGEFTACNLLGAALWTGVWGLGTYLLEKKIAAAHFTLRLLEPWIAALSLLIFVVLVIYLHRPGMRNKNIDGTKSN
jgi:membrane protein DedA with SNARE-associated domain